MNRRAYRLFAPGLAFSIVGALVLWVGAKDSFRLRGGLIVTGLYGLAAQILLTLLLITSIDDFGDRAGVQRTGTIYRGLVDQYNDRARSFSFSRTLLRFYLELALPMALLSFGLGATLSAIVDGAFTNHQLTRGGGHPSEVVLAAIMIVGAGFLLVKGNVGSFCGWCLGFALAATVGQHRFIETTDLATTLRTWLLLAGALCLTRLLVAAVANGLRRRAHRRKVVPVVG